MMAGRGGAIASMTAALRNRFSAGQIAPFGQFADLLTRENTALRG